MKELFLATDNTLYMIIFGVISIISGIITKKTWEFFKKTNIKIRFVCTVDKETPISKILTVVIMFIGSICTIILMLSIFIITISVINIGMIWAIGLYYTTGHYLLVGIYFCTTLLGMALKDYF